jgi:hypothetical protein
MFGSGRWLLFIFIYSLISFTNTSEVTYTTSKTERIHIQVVGASLKILTHPLHGNVEIEDSNKLTYTPQNMLKQGPHFTGKVLFSYSTKTGETTSVTHVTVEVTNHKPGWCFFFKLFRTC